MSEKYLSYFDEVIQSTIEIHSIARELTGRFLPHSCSIAMFGSASWGSYYSVNKDSDLDLELVIDKPYVPSQFLLVSQKGKDQFARGFELFEISDAQVFLFRFPYRDRVVALHFIRKSSFEEMMTIKISGDNCRVGFQELRNYFDGNLLYDNRCSFGNRKRSWGADYRPFQDMHLLTLPFFQIEDDEFYNGIFSEWHLTQPVILGGDTKWFEGLINGFFEECVRRMVYEEKAKGTSLEFTNILARKNRMPPWILAKINARADKLSNYLIQ